MGLKNFIDETANLLGLKKKEVKKKRLEDLLKKLQARKKKLENKLQEKNIDKKNKKDLEQELEIVKCLLKKSKNIEEKKENK